MTRIWTATLLVAAGCYQPDAPIAEYEVARDALDLGTVSYAGAGSAQAAWSLLNTGGLDLVVTPLRFEGEGHEVLSWGDYSDYTRVAPGEHTTMIIGFAAAPSAWVAGPAAPSLVVEIGALWNDPRDWATDPTWEPTEIAVPVTFEVRCDLDDDGTDAAACGGLDCDDDDADIHPGVVEVCDGVDADCDGLGDDDDPDVPGQPWYRDSDADGAGDPAVTVDACAAPAGYVATADDCDDTDATVAAGKPETTDGRDEDCDVWIDETDVAAGDIVVTELMVDPAGEDDAGVRWIELHNTQPVARRLDGWALVLREGDATTPVYVSPDAALTVAPFGYALLCEDIAAVEARWSSVTCAYEYGTADDGLSDAPYGPSSDPAFLLGPAGDTLTLAVDTTMVDTVTYDAAWPLEEGASLSLDPARIDAVANDDAGGWCAASSDLDAVDHGTPGRANDACTPEVP